MPVWERLGHDGAGAKTRIVPDNGGPRFAKAGPARRGGPSWRPPMPLKFVAATPAQRNTAWSTPPPLDGPAVRASRSTPTASCSTSTSVTRSPGSARSANSPGSGIPRRTGRWTAGRSNDLDLAGRVQFREHFDERFWSSLPALPGAVAACQRLHQAGFELVCVSALEPRFEAARLGNLRALGFPIEHVVATGHTVGETSPKAAALRALRPVAFVDDYLPYLRGIPREVHAALVLRAPNGSPNVGDELELAHSTHADLADFADHWLGR